MTNSQVKRAIDETIGKQPLMNETFVQKVVKGKKRREKRMPFLPPALVALLLFVIGGVLYMMPQSDEQLADDPEENMYLAKPEHLNEMVVQNRNESRIIYVFDNGTLHYTSDTRLFYEKPKSEDEKPYSGELIEGTYTNIQVKTKDNQYFITGDEDFSWTLTRIGPRILVDEKGIEYIIPYAFENKPKISSDILLEGDIKSLRVYKINGLGTNTYVLEENLDEVNELLVQAAVNKEFINLDKPELTIDIEIEYYNGKKEKLVLWIYEGKRNLVMKSGGTIFTVPIKLADYFYQLVENIEEIDSK